MTGEQRAYRSVLEIRRIMRDEGIDPNLADVAEFYHSRPDVQTRVAETLSKNFQDFK